MHDAHHEPYDERYDNRYEDQHDNYDDRYSPQRRYSRDDSMNSKFTENTNVKTNKKATLFLMKIFFVLLRRRSIWAILVIYVLGSLEPTFYLCHDFHLISHTFGQQM